MTERPSLKPTSQVTLGTLIYAMREGAAGTEVLMMRRNKQPNLGLWVAPGGKVERHESPHEGALREFQEETGLRADGCTLRGLVTEVLVGAQWFLFIYIAHGVSGEVVADEREGLLRWIPLAELATLAVPVSDAIFGPQVLDPAVPFFEATMRFDHVERLISYTIHQS